jgi:protein-S-isoprenylcysteine O-methyltransferase Ste14
VERRRVGNGENRIDAVSPDAIGLFAVGGLLLWSLSVWHGGALLVREVRATWRAGFRSDAVGLVLGVGVNLLNIAYEIARLATGWPNPALPIPAPVRIAGLIVFACGFVVALFARHRLAGAWTATPRCPDGGIQTHGPYAYVRHPIYASATVVYAGLLLAQANLTGTLVYSLHIFGFVAKAVREDRLLIGMMHDEYGRYRQQVRWGLFPGLW